MLRPESPEVPDFKELFLVKLGDFGLSRELRPGLKAGPHP
jgi:hypothetical protein